MYSKTKAVNLKKTAYTKKDSLVTSYTLKWGKRTFLARGLRKPDAKLRSALHPLHISRIIFVEGKRFPIITGAELEQELEKIKGNFFYHSLAIYIAETVDRLIQEPIRQPFIFQALITTLSTFNKKQTSHRKAQLTSVWFILTVLKKEGFSPQLKRCVVCSKKIDSNSNFYFDFQKKGRVCKHCQKKKKTNRVKKFNQSTLLILKRLLNSDAPLLFKNLSPSQLKELIKFTTYFLYNTLGFKLSTHSLFRVATKIN